MKAGERQIANGKEYTHLFPISKGENKIIKPNATLEDTVKLMKKAIQKTLADTYKIAQVLEGSSQTETCSNIWQFCFDHLQYTKDEEGKEQVRRPSRTWKDRKQGVDCDCMSVFIGSILTNLRIPFSLRLTKYESPEFEHVYPIAHTDNGVIIMDAVIHKFNREVPYSAKKDIKMELQFLNGFEDEEFDGYEELDEILDNDYPMDAQAFMLDDEDLNGLFKSKAERQAKKVQRKEKRAEKKEVRLEKKEVRKEKRAEFKKLPLREKLKRGLNVVNKYNPVTALLRVGVLASMKLNVMKVASKLRFAYWSDSDAQRSNMDMSKFQQLKQIRVKLEKIFFGAGGKTENLKKAMLTGKGNRDRQVVLNGLGEISYPVYDEDRLSTILGEDVFEDELLDVDFGVNGLGAVATSAAIASAAGVVGTVAALIKKLGSLFRKGTPQAEQEAIQENTDNEEEKTRKYSTDNLIARSQTDPSAVAEQYEGDDIDFEEFGEDNAAIEKTANDANEKGADDSEKKGVVEWVKANPIATAGIAVGTVGLGYLIYKTYAKKKKSLSGVPKSRKVKRKKPIRRKTVQKPKARRVATKSVKRRRKSPIRKTTRVKKVALL